MQHSEIIELACLLEATAPKLGNVHPGAAFDDACYADFVKAASAVAKPLSRAGEVGVGRAILDAVQATRAAVGTNVNLGIILLLAPLAAVSEGCSLEDALGSLLLATTRQDAAFVFEAIRTAKPGGLGAASQQDVSAAPSVTLTEAMQLAAQRDMIAEQYASGFEYVLTRCGPWLAAGLHVAERQGLRGTAAVLGAICYLQRAILADRADTLIVRKCGLAAAEEVRERFRTTFTDLGHAPLAAESPIPVSWSELDRWLRSENHRRNPGATADLIAATVFVALGDGWIPRPSPEDVSDLARQIASQFTSG